MRGETGYLRSRAVVAIRCVKGETPMASIPPEWKVHTHSGSWVCSTKQKRNSAVFYTCALQFGLIQGITDFIIIFFCISSYSMHLLFTIKFLECVLLFTLEFYSLQEIVPIYFTMFQSKN